jgi:hypothetical protein
MPSESEAESIPKLALDAQKTVRLSLRSHLHKSYELVRD